MPPRNSQLFTVESVFPFGVFVRAADGTPAYIRRRELTLSGDVDPRTVTHIGDQVRAEVLAPAKDGKLPELSVRRLLPDPWPEFVRRYKAGDVVRATIKHLSEDGIRAELQPGVDGTIDWSEVTVPSDRRDREDLLWLDDTTDALITELDPHSRTVRLSIRQLLLRLSAFEPVLQEFYAAHPPDVDAGAAGAASVAGAGTMRQPQLPGDILIVDDEGVLRSSLADWFATLNCRTACASSAKEALDLCTRNSYSLIIADLNMPYMDGLTMIRQLHARGWDHPVAVMSTPETIATQIQAIRELGIAAVFTKPLDQQDIARFLLELSEGRSSSLSLDRLPSHLPADNAPFQQLAAGLPQQSAADRMDDVLNWVVQETGADQGIVFQLAPSAKMVSIVAECGRETIDHSHLPDIIYSPIRDVIRDGMHIWENNVSARAKSRFRHLRTALEFESCIGIRLQAGGRRDHALFLFAAKPDWFPPARLRVAQTAAVLVDAVLERKSLEEIVFSLGRLFASGQWAAQLGHEVNNKASGLDLQLSVLRSRFEQLVRTADAKGDVAADLRALGDALSQTERINTELIDTVGGYHRLMRAADQEGGDTNDAVTAAYAQLKALADRQGIAIRRELARDLPTTFASTTRLQLVIYNIMLNAIQHLAEHGCGRRVLTVSTGQALRNGETLLQVRIADTGPGVHRRLWERIFEPGFTLRKDGSGLGLFISRMLLAPANGSVLVEESAMLSGTTFLIEVPALYQDSLIRS